jgi:hypothetical protein
MLRRWRSIQRKTGDCTPSPLVGLLHSLVAMGLRSDFVCFGVWLLACVGGNRLFGQFLAGSGRT